MDIDLISIDELCKKLNLSKSWVYLRTRNNTIPVIRFGKYLRFRLDDVVAYFEKGVPNGKPDIPNNTDV